MREIKFRAFIKWANLILEVESIDFKRKRVYCKTELNKKNPCDFYNFDDIELIQYTGLKDKNGLEIYEGDIIYLGKMFKNEKENNINGVVEFNVNCFGVPCFCIKENDDIFHSFFNIRDSETFWFEVIGNIYENKDLLE